MSDPRPIPSPLTIRRQREASDPAASVFVSANAGTGKTTVLTRRVVRLLLSGVDPMRILCVTFTKVAAANMQERVFDLLSEWVTLSDDALAARIADIEGRPATSSEMHQARRLFARALETPGGLKIQTIHALCQRLLNQFPFEAGVPARFDVLEEDTARDLLETALDDTLAEAIERPAGAVGTALARLTAELGAASVRDAVAAAVAAGRKAGAAPEAKYAASPVRQALGVGPAETVEAVERDLLEAGPIARSREIIPFLEGGKVTARKAAEALRHAVMARDSETYARVFLTKDLEPLKSPAGLTNDLRRLRPDLAAMLEEEAQRLLALLARRTALVIAERNEALGVVAEAVSARFAAAKARAVALDYDDMIRLTAGLLTADRARWVLFKLDQGIDHVLVDEAQDTSPVQWQIINALTAEFFAGEGARGRAHRTLFAVGDEKQSIFGFQGADPAGFDSNRQAIERRALAAGEPFRRVPLTETFRSVETIVRSVDLVFGTPEARAGLTADGAPVEHDSARRARGGREGLPGLVELWPVISGQKRTEPDPLDPVDRVPAGSPPVLLARRIAGTIQGWIDSGERFASDGRPVTAGDILILVRGRRAVLHALIRALRAADLPIGGVDRVRLSEQIAVADIAALDRFALLPDDDLTLAAVLRSPFCDLDDEDLLTLRDGSDASLWDRLRAQGQDARIAAVAARLERWRSMANRLDPVAWHAALLGPEGGRAMLVGRLGDDAAEAIDVFRTRLARWQQLNPPSLQRFVAHLASSDADVRRDLDDPAGRIRLMTVHGAKGLESRIVILADGMANATAGGTLLTLEGPAGDVTALLTGADKPPPDAVTRARQKALEAAIGEHKRLLYVAMTRAKDRLYIAGQFNVQRPSTAVWHDLVREAFEQAADVRPVEGAESEGAALRYQAPAVADAPAAPPAIPPPPVAIDPPGTEWLGRPPPAGDLPAAVTSPSRLGRTRTGDAAAPRSGGLALARGQLVHDLLDRLSSLPRDRRAAAAHQVIAVRHQGLPDRLASRIADDTLALLDDPRLSAVFAPAARTEVAIAGRVRVGGQWRLVSGRIDRLADGPDGLLAIDFKTGRPPGDGQSADPAHLRQMAVYHALLTQIAAGRPVRVGLLYTDGPLFAELRDAEMAAALEVLAGPVAP
jgi:ATP-dependent helicase/nuclease subunit A